MLLDAEQRHDGWFKEVIFDVCICGAGPAGITLARALAGKGRRVALMEGGDAMSARPTSISRCSQKNRPTKSC